jgi:hypothetical protein
MSFSIKSKLALTIALALTLSACGGGDEVAQVDDQSLVTEVEEAPQASGGFDAPVVTPDKVSYTLSSPASSHLACCLVRSMSASISTSATDLPLN